MNEIEIVGTFRVFENLWYPAIVHYTSLNITV
jgi:hypothetical protein